MTKTSDFASKAVVAVAAIAMAFSVFAAPAKAQSTEDLQKMINDLLAQVAALQGKTGSASAAGVCPFTWTRDLNTGATGADVKALQQFLNANADTRVSASGAGSAGMETEYFGPATAAAVSKFQVMYRADVLTPAGLTNPTGYFGPGTRAKANALCVASSNGGSTTDDEDEDEDSSELSGEASFKDATLDSASDDDVEEGSEDAEVAEFTVEFEDGDAEISRIDVKLDSGDSSDAWDAFETVSLWVDGDMVAEKDASDDSDYQNDEKTIRFSGLDIVAMEDEELEIVVAVTLQGNIESSDQDTYTVTIGSLRFFDADGVADTITDPANGDTATFTIQEAGFEDEIIVKTSTSDPDGTTLQVEDDKKSDWYTVFIFDLDTDDSLNDIELNEVAVTVDTSIAFGTLVDDYELSIDGVTIDDLVVNASTSANGLVTDLRFDVDGDVTIDAGDRVAAELKLRFKSLAPANEGATVRGRITSAQALAIDAEGLDDVTNLSGSATGDVHTLRTAGINVSAESVDAKVTTADGNTNDYATYVVEVEVTAFEQDAYIAIDDTASFMWSLESAAGVAVTAGTSTAVLTSTADEQGAYFLVNEGETETFTLTVTYIPGVANTAARVQLDTIEFADTEAVPDQTWTASPDTDYRTAVVTVVN
jgi:peptidoglycan hydrolase-like protein with peptidoglycan-binding domain